MEKSSVTEVPLVPVSLADWSVSVPQKNPEKEEEEEHCVMFGLSMKKPLDPLSKKAVRLELSL